MVSNPGSPATSYLTFFRWIAILVLYATLAACHTAYVCRSEICQRNKDYQYLADASLKYVEHVGPVSVFVVPSHLDRSARDALAEIRKVIDPEQMPPSASYKLPGGYFVVEKFHVDKAEAVFEGTLGPVLQSATPGSADACGTAFSIPFELEGEKWASHSYKTRICSSTNRIVPKE